MQRSQSRSRLVPKQEPVKSNDELHKLLTNVLREQGESCGLEVLVSLLYQRALIRYRLQNFLGCSRDCDRAAARVCGNVHGRILFLNAKALRRLRNWEGYCLNLYRSCVESLDMKFWKIFGSIAALMCTTPICKQTEELWVGVMLTLQKSKAALLTLLVSDRGVEFFWHLISGVKNEQSKLRGRSATSGASGSKDSSPTTMVGAQSEFTRGRGHGGGGGDLTSVSAVTLTIGDGKTVKTNATGLGTTHAGSKAGSKQATEYHQDPMLLSPQSEQNTKKDDDRTSVGGVTNTIGGATNTIGGAGNDATNTFGGATGAGAAGGSVGGTSALPREPHIQCISDVDEGIGVKDLTKVGNTDLTKNDLGRLQRQQLEFLEALGLKTLLMGLTELRNTLECWVELFEDSGLFQSLARFCNPKANLHLSFTTITLYAELVQSHPDLIPFKQVFPSIMDCLLSEKDELIHACCRFLIESNEHIPYQEHMRVNILEYLCKFVAQKCTKMRAFCFACLFPVIANATFQSVADPESFVDELSLEEKTNVLKYLKMAIEQAVTLPDVWLRVRKNITGFLYMFLNGSSDPLDDARQLARNLDEQKLCEFLVQKTVINAPLRNATGLVVLRRIVSLGWLWEPLIEVKGIGKIVSELEELYDIIARNKDLDEGYKIVEDPLLKDDWKSVADNRNLRFCPINDGLKDISNPSSTNVSPVKRNSFSKGSPQKRPMSANGIRNTPGLRSTPMRSTPAKSDRSMSPFRKHEDGTSTSKASHLASALLRVLGFLLLRKPNLRFGKEHTDETELEAVQREELEEQLQLGMRTEFLTKVGTFPTEREQWMLSLECGVSVGKGHLGKKYDYMSGGDLQRICRGHRLAGIFREFNKSKGIMSEEAVSPLIVYAPMPKFETTMKAGGSEGKRKFDGGNIEKALKYRPGKGNKLGEEVNVQTLLATMKSNKSTSTTRYGGTRTTRSAGRTSTSHLTKTPRNVTAKNSATDGHKFSQKSARELNRAVAQKRKKMLRDSDGNSSSHVVPIGLVPK